jgi:hypothetical protein
MFLFDYGDISSFERTFMKRIIPFYTWMKKNVELQAKTLVTSPGKISQEVHMFNTLSSVMSEGNGLTDSEFDNIPDYMKDQFMITTSRSGEKLHVLTNLGSPLQAAFQSIQPNSILSSANPILKLPIELVTGYDTFKGGMISDTMNASLFKNSPQVTKDLIGYVEYSYKDKKTGEIKHMYNALNPKMYFFILNQPFGSRIFKEYLHCQDTSESGTTFSSEENIRRFTGISSQDLDLNQLSSKEQAKRVAKLHELLSKAGLEYKIEKYLKSKTSTIEEN